MSYQLFIVEWLSFKDSCKFQSQSQAPDPMRRKQRRPHSPGTTNSSSHLPHSLLCSPHAQALALTATVTELRITVHRKCREASGRHPWEYPPPNHWPLSRHSCTTNTNTSIDPPSLTISGAQGGVYELAKSRFIEVQPPT